MMVRLSGLKLRKSIGFDAQNHQDLKFLHKLRDDIIEELISYVELNDIISDMIDG